MQEEQKGKMVEVNKQELTLLGSRLLIKPFFQEDKTKSGIFVPNQAKKSTNAGTIESRGEIVAIGTDNVKAFKIGDIVEFEIRGGLVQSVTINGAIHLPLHPSEVLWIYGKNHQVEESVVVPDAEIPEPSTEDEMDNDLEPSEN